MNFEADKLDQQEGWILVKSKRTRKAEKPKRVMTQSEDNDMDTCPYNPNDRTLPPCDFCGYYSKEGYNVCCYLRLMVCPFCAGDLDEACPITWRETHRHYVATAYCPCVFKEGARYIGTPIRGWYEAEYPSHCSK